MSITLLLEQPNINQTGIFNLQFDRQINIKISAGEAQRRVTRYVHWEISSQMHAEEPSLVVDFEAFWRVPVHLTFPAFGDMGCVGYVKVDPVTGNLDTSPEMIKQLTEKAEERALRFTSSAT